MSTILGLLHNPSNSLQAHTKTMAPSSNQASTTPNKTNPDLRLTLESPNSPPLTPSLNNHSPTPQTYEQEMEMLEQLWSGLSLEHTFEGTVSYVRIPVHPRAAMQWNQMTQTPSLPLRLDPPPHSHPSRSHRFHVRVHRTSHSYHTQTRQSRVPPVRQWSTPTSSSSAASLDPLPATIFRFLDQGKINIVMREDEPNLYIIMYSNRSLPFVMSSTHWAKFREVEALYHLKTTSVRHQCLLSPTPRIPASWGVLNESLTPFSSSMKMIS